MNILDKLLQSPIESSYPNQSPHRIMLYGTVPVWKLKKLKRRNWQDAGDEIHRTRMNRADFSSRFFQSKIEPYGFA